MATPSMLKQVIPSAKSLATSLNLADVRVRPDMDGLEVAEKVMFAPEESRTWAVLPFALEGDRTG